jgi:hypothetical protein
MDILINKVADWKTEWLTYILVSLLHLNYIHKISVNNNDFSGVSIKLY